MAVYSEGEDMMKKLLEELRKKTVTTTVGDGELTAAAQDNKDDMCLKRYGSR